VAGAAGVRVRLAAAGLGQSAADHVADGEDADDQPRLVGCQAVVLAVAGLGEQTGEQDADGGGDVGVELGRLGGVLGLRAQACSV
jgi:hypothetical protein